MDTTISSRTFEFDEPSSSVSSKEWKYDVFLSFRGIDTRRCFTDHLYCTLKAHRVNVFIDENELHSGESISDELKQAIQGSRIAAVVFSKRYAESTWCLEELEKIMECRRTMGLMVLPIFYHVEPCHVRKQSGCFAEAFRTHEERFRDDVDKVQRWRSAFTEAGNLSGGNLKNADGYEGKFIRKIVKDITTKLNNTGLHVAANQIGIDSRVQDISNNLHVGGTDDVRIIGILGMVGTGKTTLAKAIFNKFHQRFEGKSFLSKVREGDMVKLQSQLLCDILKPANIEVTSVDQGTKEIKERLGKIRVLVIFDGIERPDQLDELAIRRKYFGPGSRIIITTRNEQLLNILEVDKKYSAQAMNDEEALQLLSCRAFSESYPCDEEYRELARAVVNYCGGLPLALEVLGSSLFKKTKREWRNALRKLKKRPDAKIYKKLKLSYEGLIDDEVKAVFLDICCFFIGKKKDYVTTILDGCDFDTEIGIGELRDQCLLSVDEGNNLMMHDLLRDMGREIVREKSPNITGKRCRLWDHEEVIGVLKNQSGTDEVEGLVLDLQEPHKSSFSAEVFEKMQGLRLLKLKGAKFTGYCEHISQKLSWLCWPEFPLEAIPGDFNLPNLVDMDLSHSPITVWKDPDVMLEKLKFLNLGGCDRLKRSPDFSKLPNLEHLILEGCKSLSKLHPSIGRLEKLKYLSLANCNLTAGPIPEDLGALSSLQVLDLGGNNFCELPILSGLSKLQQLQLNNCTNLSVITGLPTNLEVLEANECTALEKLLPILSGLSKLRKLQLNNCTNLQVVTGLPTNLEVLEANECTALEKLPDFSEMSSMRELHLNRSHKLTEIPGLEKSLKCMTEIRMEGCIKLTAAFKEAIQKEWNARGKTEGLFLSPSDCPSPHLSEYNEDGTHEAGPADDLNGSHKRLRSGCRVESNAAEGTHAVDDSLKRVKVSGDQDITISSFTLSKTACKLKQSFEEASSPVDEELVHDLSMSGIPNWFLHRSHH